MKWDELLKRYKKQPIIEARMLASDPAELPKIRVQLSRWVKSGRLVKVRNGLYLLSDAYRTNPSDIEYVATFACRPSYISLEYALASFGLIPEMVPSVTLVTTKRPQKLSVAKKILIYRHIDKRLFWGYSARGEKNFEVFFAEPEKAVLDLFYLTDEKIDIEYLREMRFQNTENMDKEKLIEYASIFDTPKIRKAAELFCAYIDDERKMREL